MSNDGMSYDDSLSAFGHADDDAHQAIDAYYNGLINNILYNGAHAAVAALQNGDDGSGAWMGGGSNNAAMSPFTGGQDSGLNMPGLGSNQASGSPPNILGMDLINLARTPNQPGWPNYNFGDANGAGGNTLSAGLGSPVTLMNDPNETIVSGLPAPASGAQNTINSSGYDPNSHDIFGTNSSGDVWPGINTNIGGESQPFQIDPRDPYGIGATAIGLNNGDGSQPSTPGASSVNSVMPDSSDDRWYNPFPSNARYAVDQAPDLSKGEGIQPMGLNGRGYIPQDGDRELLARIMFAESGKAPKDYPLIGWTVVNRIGERQFRPTLQGVITQPYGGGKGHQFVGYNSPEWDLTADPSSLTGVNALRYAQAQQVAGDILSGNIPDPTAGADFFHAGTTPPAFFQSRIDSGRFVRIPVGAQSSFYRDTQN